MVKISRPDLDEKTKTVPARVGVYLFRDGSNRVLYVGKATNLRSRVRSYFSPRLSPKHWRLAQEVADIEFIITESEMEALILECNLIKRHRPPYNVRFKDDKRYPYVKVTWQEDFPRIQIVRRMAQDKAKYYGPFASSTAMREMLDTIRRIFPYLTCTRKITGMDRRACLYYYIHRCPAPCTGAISREMYRALVERLCLFLEGRYDKVLDSLRDQMAAASNRLEFERAAMLRDQINGVERAMERQRAVFQAKVDQDVIAVARRDQGACAQVFLVRGGKLIGRESFVLDGSEGAEEREILTAFVKQFYNSVAYIPPEIILADQIGEAGVIEKWLKERRGGRVALMVPRRGKKRELVRLVQENAAQTLAHVAARSQVKEGEIEDALSSLQDYLGLEGIPHRIEAYDISNIQGKEATGSMVVFTEGRPKKAEYRHFKIRTVEGADDYAMMREVLSRRFRRAEEDTSWATLPDLMVIDGGKGQLNTALEVLGEFGLEIPAIGLAKEEEEVYHPKHGEPLRLPVDSGALHLLQRLRDEAHRFAVEYHRKLRGRGTLASILEEIPGIGPKRRRALIKRFRSLEAIRQAPSQELASAEGMNQALAQRVKELL